MNDVQEIEAQLRLISAKYGENKKLHIERSRKFQAQQRFLEKRSAALLARRHRLILAAVVEQPGAVRVRFPYPETSPCHLLNDQAGTLLELKRTTCRVSFNGKPRTFPIDRIIPIDRNELHWSISEPDNARVLQQSDR